MSGLMFSVAGANLAADFDRKAWSMTRKIEMAGFANANNSRSHNLASEAASNNTSC